MGICIKSRLHLSEIASHNAACIKRKSRKPRRRNNLAAELELKQYRQQLKQSAKRYRRVRVIPDGEV
jgi:hypothetical protein